MNPSAASDQDETFSPFNSIPLQFTPAELEQYRQMLSGSVISPTDQDQPNFASAFNVNAPHFDVPGMPFDMGVAQAGPSDSSIRRTSSNGLLTEASASMASGGNSSNGSGTKSHGKKDGKGEVRHMWTPEETEALAQGCIKHGVGNWKDILNDPELRHRFGPERNPGDLKDRFRTKFPAAYHELYPNAKSHITSSATRRVSEGGKSHFEKGKAKERRAFTAAEDAVLKEGYEAHGASWTIIAKHPVFEARRKPTDLRDRFRNAFPHLYEQAGYKPRQKSGKGKERTLSHGSSHTSHSHHDHAVPLPKREDTRNADLDSAFVIGPDGKPAFDRTDSALTAMSNYGYNSNSAEPPSSSSASEAVSDADMSDFDPGIFARFDASLGAPPASTGAGANVANVQTQPIPGDWGRSLSFGSGMPPGQGGAANNSRPLFISQQSLPPGVADFSQTMRDGLSTQQQGFSSSKTSGARQPQSHSGDFQQQPRQQQQVSDEYQRRFDHQTEMSRMAEWHMQQARLLQEQAQREAEHQRQFQQQQQQQTQQQQQQQQQQPQDVKRSHSLSRTQPRIAALSPSAGSGGLGVSPRGASSASPFTPPKTDVTGPASMHFPLGFDASAGQSQSLPPSHCAPANFQPDLIPLPFDEQQLRQLNEILQGHASGPVGISGSGAPSQTSAPAQAPFESFAQQAQGGGPPHLDSNLSPDNQSRGASFMGPPENGHQFSFSDSEYLDASRPLSSGSFSDLLGQSGSSNNGRSLNGGDNAHSNHPNFNPVNYNSDSSASSQNQQGGAGGELEDEEEEEEDTGVASWFSLRRLDGEHEQEAISGHRGHSLTMGGFDPSQIPFIDIGAMQLSSASSSSASERGLHDDDDDDGEELEYEYDFSRENDPDNLFPSSKPFSSTAQSRSRCSRPQGLDLPSSSLSTSSNDGLDGYDEDDEGESDEEDDYGSHGGGVRGFGVGNGNGLRAQAQFEGRQLHGEDRDEEDEDGDEDEFDEDGLPRSDTIQPRRMAKAPAASEGGVNGGLAEEGVGQFTASQLQYQQAGYQ